MPRPSFSSALTSSATEKEGLGTRLDNNMFRQEKKVATKKHKNKDSKDGNRGQGSFLLLCHHYKAIKNNFKCITNKQPKTEDKKKK